jgi:eukaryotic-like serine/threonine-protein kinase
MRAEKHFIFYLDCAFRLRFTLSVRRTNPMDELDLFAAAIALSDPAEQNALLDRECAGKPDLRERLELLLAAHGRSNPLLDKPVARRIDEPNQVGTVDYVGPSESEGTIIAGKYKLLQQIGEGGMGAVWMADQTEPVKRRVAVKLIRVERGQSKTILSRFEAERQAIALMDHPHIAKLLDAGITGEARGEGREARNASTGTSSLASRPYFVMELVKGVPLTDFCDSYKLNVPERLALFAQICSAVQHAHQKGVIHRDLKPTNILVESHDGKPVPKVIDFGLAKATTGLQLSEHTLFTAFGSVMGTPLYMAPEQARFNAVDVDTRADIYALGVILYELLTGTTPLTRETIKKAALDEMLKLIREQEAPTPSSRLSTAEAIPTIAANRQSDPAKLGRFVKGELDWIVLKALAKDRDRRYETANGFARDIERFLHHEPVQAGPPSARYRIRKFVQRHRGQVIAAGVVLLALVLGIAGTTFGLIRATRAAEAERLAKMEAEEQRESALRSAAREAAQRQKAEAARAEAQAKEAEANAVVKFFEDRVFAAGRPKGEEGGLGHDVPLRDAIRASLPSLTASFKDQPLVEARLRLAVGTTFAYLGDYTQAAEQYEKSRALFIRHRGPDHSDTLKSMQDLANSYAALDRQADALKLREETLAARKRVLPPDHRDTLTAMHNLALSYADLNRHADALKLREETLAAQKRMLPPDHPEILRSMHNLASSYAALNRHAEALKLREETLAARKRVLPPDHPETLASMTNLANSYAALNRHAEALKLREETLAALKRVLPPDHPETLGSMTNLANSYAALNRHAEALKLREETLAARKRVLPPDHPETLGSMTNLANSYAALNRHAEALELLNEILAEANRPGVDPSLVPFALGLRMLCCQKLGDVAGCRASAELLEKHNPTDAGSLYDAACYRAVTASLQAKAKEPDAARLAKEDADKAMAWLTKAVAAGWTNAAHMRKDTDLDFLRQREDFKGLLAELEEKAVKR